MAPEKAPAFQFYPKDFLADARVAAMTMEQRGAYITLLCHCWTETTLSVEPEALARLLKVTPKALARIWPALQSCFQQGEDGSLRQKRLDMERAKQAEHREKRRIAAERRWAAEKNASAMHVHSTSNALQSSSSSAICDLPSAKKSEEPPNSRSKRPIFSGQRLTVFEWQLDDCAKTLGEFTDGFDLHAWFWDLDAQAVASGLVVPKRDSGAWLQSQLVAEAQRRGLPLRMATTAPQAGKLTTRLATAIANIAAEDAHDVKRLQ